MGRIEAVRVPFDLPPELRDRMDAAYEFLVQAQKEVAAAGEEAGKWREAMWMQHYGIEVGSQLCVTEAIRAMWDGQSGIQPACPVGTILIVTGFSVFGQYVRFSYGKTGHGILATAFIPEARAAYLEAFREE